MVLCHILLTCLIHTLHIHVQDETISETEKYTAIQQYGTGQWTSILIFKTILLFIACELFYIYASYQTYSTFTYKDLNRHGDREKKSKHNLAQENLKEIWLSLPAVSGPKPLTPCTWSSLWACCLFTSVGLCVFSCVSPCRLKFTSAFAPLSCLTDAIDSIIFHSSISANNTVNSTIPYLSLNYLHCIVCVLIKAWTSRRLEESLTMFMDYPSTLGCRDRNNFRKRCAHVHTFVW